MTQTLVLGMGKSGRAAAELLKSRGRDVLCFDDHLQEGTIGDVSKIDWESIAQLVVSPGVPIAHPVYQGAVKRGIEVIGEIELALRFLSQRAVAVTGTNGKTTVTLLAEHVLNCSGIKAKALGNIGEPLSSYAMHSHSHEVLVIELSSFQIDTLYARAFDAAVLLNITPDHLDRYADMESYARSKCSLQRCLKEEASLFVQYQAAKAFGHLLVSSKCFGRTDDGVLRLDDEHPDTLDYILSRLHVMPAVHDKENALAAWIVCKPFGMTKEQFCDALLSFKKPPHRIEFVCEIEGVCYYDDSKGTNIDAVMHAVDAMTGSVILIAGGVDKGASYLPWAERFKGKVKSILVFGEAAAKIHDELHLFFEVEWVDSLSAAVQRAKEKAVRGDTVLLSPGCSSFDMFRDYAHRGQEFQRLVKENL